MQKLVHALKNNQKWMSGKCE